MKIISWNINSLRLRLPLLQRLVFEQNPDIICLQETKVQDCDFPLAGVQQLGFEHIYFAGQKSYNGVAILSKVKLEIIETIDVLDYNHKRHISAILPSSIRLHNFYVPAGGDIPDPKVNPKFDFKLKFMDWMIDYFGAKNNNQPIIMLGDINIAPEENDVWSHKQMRGVVSHTPIEIEKMLHLQKTLNWIDAPRMNIELSEKLYSWWSYRALDPFKTNRGRRLDHIWATPILKNNIKSTAILKDFRLATQPSDHVPISIELEL
jgi:exodeoxyribonuclease-3